MKRHLIIYMAAASAMLLACGGGDGPDEPGGRNDGRNSGQLVTVNASITSFRDGDYTDELGEGDEIAVYGVKDGSSLNQTTAVRYTCQRDGSFAGTLRTAGNERITYYAVCPFSANLPDFTVNLDQRTGNALLGSDVCTGNSQPTSSANVNITLNHRLAAARMMIEGLNLSEHTLSITMEGVATGARIDIDGNKTTTDTSRKGNIRMFDDDGVFRAILPPQTMPKTQEFVIVTLDGQEYPVTFEDDQYFKEGYMTMMTLMYNGDEENPEFIVVKGDINPWQ